MDIFPNSHSGYYNQEDLKRYLAIIKLSILYHVPDRILWEAGPATLEEELFFYKAGMQHFI